MVDPAVTDYTSERVKHLDMIQGVISRMAGNSAVMKRYCIIAVAVGFAVYKTIEDPRAIVVLGTMVVVFWLLAPSIYSKKGGSVIFTIRSR